MDLITPAARAFREGRLSDCHELLLRSPAKDDSEAVLAVELLNLLGRADEAEAAATRLVEANRLTESLLARCTSVLADCKWYRGELSLGLELYQMAARYAQASKDVSTICRANTQLLERTCDRTGFDSSLSLAGVVRRSVAIQTTRKFIHSCIWRRATRSARR